MEIRVKAEAGEKDDLPSRDKVEIDTEEGDLIATSTAGPGSGVTMAVPRFRTDLEALLTLAANDTPRARVVRSTQICTAFYGFGDASSDGFGATIERETGIVERYGLWAEDKSEQSLNF